MSAPTFYLSDDTSRAVRAVLSSRGCVEYNPAIHRICDLHWTTKRCLAPLTASSSSSTPPPRLCNHLPGTSVISQKDHLARTMRRMRAVYGRVYSFTPLTFILPREHSAWLTAFSLPPSPSPTPSSPSPFEESKEQLSFHPPSPSPPSPQWILKPTLSSQGRGITLPLHPPSSPPPLPSIAQRYIHPPHLLHSHKYDLRLYVLLTSLQPLVAYHCTEGLCRFAATPYNPSPTSLSAHLTNSSLPRSGSPPHPGGGGRLPVGGKWTLAEYEGEVGGGGRVWDAVLPLLLLTLVPLVSVGVGGGGGGGVGVGGGEGGGFEVLGFDVMRDEGGKWWVVEVNRSPSMVVKGAEDEAVKGRLLRDLMDVIGVSGQGRAQLPADSGGGVGCWRPLWPTTAREQQLNQRVSEARGKQERLSALVVAQYMQAIVDAARRRLGQVNGKGGCAIR